MKSRGDRALTPKFSLPLVGLGFCYYEFSKTDPDTGVRRHRGDLVGAEVDKKGVDLSTYPRR